MYPRVFLDDVVLPKPVAVSSLVSPYTCFECGVSGLTEGKAMKRCSDCKKVYFCGEECGRKAWKRWHSVECATRRGDDECVSMPSSPFVEMLLES